jgi:N-acyl-D-aspartate/D-glutamate deacylase
MGPRREASNAGEGHGPFQSSWVAIRDGRVVATAADLADLRRNPEVRREDVKTQFTDSGQ